MPAPRADAGGSGSSGDSAAPVPPSVESIIPASLQPAANCVQPQATPSCESGYCRVEPGCFIMGAPRNEPGAGRYSNVQVQVTLTRPFSMGRTEVTNAQWLESGWGPPKRDIVIGEETCRQPGCPVANVSFFDALRYANWLSEREALPPCYALEGCTGTTGLDLECSSVMLNSPTAYDCMGYRLPMEAEWEYAARAGTRTAFYGGDAVSRSLNECLDEPALNPLGWYCANSGEVAHPVGEKLANAWGLHDMLGNLYEWCNDYHDGLGYGDGPLTDPVGTKTPGRELLPLTLSNGDPGRIAPRIMRGGDYVLSGDACTAADRGSSPSFVSSAAIGFRLVRSLSSQQR